MSTQGENIGWILCTDCIILSYTLTAPGDPAILSQQMVASGDQLVMSFYDF